MLWHILPKRSLSLIGATACAFFAGGNIGALAQSPADARPERPWEVMLVLGRPYGGPADDLEQAMRSSGWDDTTLINPGIDHPFSSGPDLSWAISLRRTLRPHMDVELMAARPVTGGTVGHQAAGDHFLFLNHSVTTIAPMVSYKVEGWHVGAGATFNRVRVENEQGGDPGVGSVKAWKLGALADTGVAYPRRSRLFFEARGQYRWVPVHTAGPFTSPGRLPGQEPASMPAVDVDMSHAFFALGLGARF
jgi:hypothetical protein